MDLRGNRKLIAFCVAIVVSAVLTAFSKLGSEAFMAVAIAALGGFFTANVVNHTKTPQSGKGT